MSPCCCSRLEHVPIATAVRLPSAAPAPIGRVLDAGADAIIVAMIETAEQAAEAVAATRFAPGGVRSFGPLRASLGVDVAALEARVSVYAMVETARGLAALDEICAVPGLVRRLRRARRSGDLDGPRIGRRLDPPRGARAMAQIVSTATAAGLVTGVHAGDGAIGRAPPRWVSG